MIARIIVFIIALYSCSAFAAPDEAPMPRDRIEVIGTIPENVNATLLEIWRTTTDSIFCQYLRGEAGFSADGFARRPEPTLDASGHRTWFVWRDGFKTGRCGWELQEIMVYLDAKASGKAPERPGNIGTRIAILHNFGESGSYGPAMNDDSEKPTYHHCDFSTLENLRKGNAYNPCQFFDQKTRGTDLSKYENILRPDQHVVRFVIDEIQRKKP